MAAPPHQATLHAANAGEHAFLVAVPAQPGGALRDAADAYARIAEWLRSNNLTPVHERAFGSLSVEPAVRSTRAAALDAGDFSHGPLTYVEGRPPWGEGWAGTILHAIRRDDRTPDVPAFGGDQDPALPSQGRCWQRHGATFFVLQDVRAAGAKSGDRQGQARAMIARADEFLHAHHAAGRDMVRTWFYLADILAWYDGFNATRTAAYRELGLLPDAGPPDRLPASTAIEGRSAGGRAATLDLFAVVAGPTSAVEIRPLRSPRQPEAFEYGSAFARGVVIRQPDVALIEVSGTAAVDETGHSLYPGDARAQIRYTLETVAELLAQEHAALTDIRAATAFVKHSEDAAVLQEVLREFALEQLPVVCVVANICRPELLFELDAEATVGPIERVPTRAVSVP